MRQLAEPRGFSKRAECHVRLGDVDAALEDFRQAITLGGDDPDLHGRIGTLLQTRGDLTGAATHYRQALAGGSRRPEIALSLAWILSTAAEPALRSPSEAVRLAEPVCEDPRMRNGATLDVLAAAYAAAGRFDDAVEAARKGAKLASDAGRTAYASEIEARLDLFENKKTWSEPN